MTPYTPQDVFDGYDDKIKRMAADIKLLVDEKKRLEVENSRLAAELERLKAENSRLTAENKRLMLALAARTAQALDAMK